MKPVLLIEDLAWRRCITPAMTGSVLASCIDRRSDCVLAVTRLRERVKPMLLMVDPKMFGEAAPSLQCHEACGCYMQVCGGAKWWLWLG